MHRWSRVVVFIFSELQPSRCSPSGFRIDESTSLDAAVYLQATLYADHLALFPSSPLDWNNWWASLCALHWISFILLWPHLCIWPAVTNVKHSFLNAPTPWMHRPAPRMSDATACEWFPVNLESSVHWEKKLSTRNEQRCKTYSMASPLYLPCTHCFQLISPVLLITTPRV